jgi:preprotein translocase subunit SecD
MSGHSWKLLMIIALFVVAFLVTFQPIGRPPKEVFSTFRVTFTAPIARPGVDVAKQVRDALIQGGVAQDEIDQVRAINDREVEIATLALDQQQADKDKAGILAAMQAAYKGNAVTIGLPPGTEGGRKPLWQIGNALAVYKPMPRITLGLDLQGGAHVVLRCLPYARVIFQAPAGQPYVIPSAAEEAKAVAPTWKTTETADTLTKRVAKALADAGVAPEAMKIDLASPTLLIAETHPVNKKEMTKHELVVTGALKAIYPAYKEGDIKVDDSEAVFLEAGIADKVKTIIDRRLYSMSEIREPVIQKQGDDRIIVELPGVRDPDRVLRILKSTAVLKFLLVPTRYEAATPGEDKYDEWRDKTSGQTVGWDRVLAESPVKFSGRDLKSNSKVGPGNKADWVVHFELVDKKKREFQKFTRDNVGRIMAIVLDDKCQMAPVIKDAIPGAGIIEGNFTTQAARDLETLLNAGALPVPLEIAENRTVSATLGRDSVVASLRAAIIGFLAVTLFMLSYYRLPGFLADCALVLYVVMLLALLIAANVTLTLPGIAGLIISIGVAVDANVLIFERLKEELWGGKGMRAAMEAGFHRAWTAILDSHVTTLIASGVLYLLGAGSIKTFAVTLFLGVLMSLFTAVVVTRWLLDIVGSTRLGQHVNLYMPGASRILGRETGTPAAR